MTISIQHIRNATSVLTVNGKSILVDPMLSDVGELPPVPFTRSLRRNPITPLPVPLHLFENMDAVLLTHRHFDHLDKKAISVLNKRIPVFCQPEDQAFLQTAGFFNIQAVHDSFEWCGIQMKRIKGQHARGIVAKMLGPVSGFILSTSVDGSIYIVGDCIYTPAIGDVFRETKPDIAILNTPRAQMLLGTIITMTAEDIVHLAQLSPATKIVAVHMDAISHCTFKRQQLRAFLKEHNLEHVAVVPDDGEIISF
ncbi:MBL fold metallo-hydrolase [Paenibacillus harenae]|uniref:L-ascorbate metabolism protein UlaG (Beta-lactamase superfamily) n=1 Tax=Paenibacillus harenae TaxID=306543 RepID=A0ABT9UAA8_PAEHA|nr:MBL fold metallo-hydrolase [Paenibacillus harenae]MDQ0116187.1 L-ascorbate metabolism protein UlaG (beta-lactamase superfamily) [Paenibacillus harenae]